MKQIYEKTKIEGQFDGIIPPVLEFSEIILTETKTLVKNKKGEVLEENKDFNLKIKMKDGLKKPDVDLGNAVKDLIGLSWVPFSYQDRSFNTYSTKYNGDLENKKKLLNDFFELFKDYDKKRKSGMEKNSSEFENDITNNNVLVLPRFIVKYNKDLNVFVVLAKVRLGDDFNKLSGCALASFPFDKEIKKDNFLNLSLYEEKIKYQSLLSRNFFDEFNVKSIKGKYVFLIDQSNYSFVKDFILSEKTKLNEYKEKQIEISQKYGEDVKSVEVLDKNIFNLKIEYDENNYCFNFYCAGAADSSNQMENKVEWMNKSVVSIWAKNYILSKTIDEEITFLFIDRGGQLGNKEKIELDKQIGSSFSEKKVIVPLTDLEKIKEIKSNYDKEMKFWGRTDYKVIMNLPEYMSVSGAPLILFHKNFPYFVYKSTSKKIEGEWKTNFYGKRISVNEALFYLNEHEMKDFIKEKAINYNYKIHTGNDVEFKEKNVFLDQLIMAATVWEKTEKPRDKKRMKI